MNERITALNISDVLATQLTFPKRVTDSFMRSFTETIIEGLNTDGIVKVRGLGTFRIVDVESRESVSVSTGERIVIPSFKKISFTAEESITERMSGNTNSESTDVQSTAELTDVQSTAESTDEETAAAPAETIAPVEEQPSDQFSGIDVLIATPESLEELHDKLTEALILQNEAEKAVSQAQKELDNITEQARLAEQNVVEAQQIANQQKAEVNHIEQLIANIESNRPVASPQPLHKEMEKEASPLSTPKEGEKDTSETSPSCPLSEEEREEDTSVVPSLEEEKEEAERNVPWWRIPVILLALLLVGAACYFVAVNPKLPLKWLKLEQSTEPSNTVQPTTPPATDASSTPVAAPDTQSIESSAAQESNNKSATPTTETSNVSSPNQDLSQPTKSAPETQPATPKTESKPQRPQTHTVKRGETLTKISQQYYGTKDSVRAIIRINKFKDPNNISAGSVIKLP